MIDRAPARPRRRRLRADLVAAARRAGPTPRAVGAWTAGCPGSRIVSRAVELLAGMSAEDRRQVLASGRRRRFAPREVVFHEGDPADTFLLIEVGRMAVRAATPLGDTVTFAVVGPGEVVGELALLDEGARRSASVVALEATEAWSFTAETFHRLRRTNAGASRATVNRVLRAVAADGLLELRRGRIVVLDPAGLTRRGSAGF